MIATDIITAVQNLTTKYVVTLARRTRLTTVSLWLR